MPSRRRVNRLCRLLDETSSAEPATARELALALRRVCPGSVRAEWELAGALIELRLFRHSRTTIARLEGLGPKQRVAAAFFKGKLHKALGELEPAERWFRRAAARGLPALVYAGTTLARRGRFEDARRTYRESLRNGLDDASEAYLNIGMTFRSQRRHTQALACFEKALALDRDYAEARELRADVRRAMTVKSRPGRRAHWRQILTELGRPSTALELSYQFTKSYPERPEGWTVRADLLAEFGRFRDAYRDLDRALQRAQAIPGGDHRRLWSALAVSYGWLNVHRTNHHWAQKWFRRAVQLKSNSDRLNCLGQALAAAGRFELARRWLDRALKQASEPVAATHALYELGLLERSKRRYPEALRYLNRAVRGDPSHERAQTARQDVRRALAIRRRYC